MASPGELVHTLAELLGIPKPTVVVHDRSLVVAGLRSKHGRGRGAATVTARDIAHLLTAVLASGKVQDSVQSVTRYTDTRPDKRASSDGLYASLGLDELSALPARHSFIDALEALIISAATGSLAESLQRDITLLKTRHKTRRIALAPMIEIAALFPGTVGDIRISGLDEGLTASVRYALPTPWDKSSRRPPPQAEVNAWEKRTRMLRAKTDLEQYRRISEATIISLSSLLTPEQESD